MVRVDFRLSDFLEQMYLATLEECPLHEVARGSEDDVAGGTVIHGPWPAAGCAAIFRVWHAAGWVELYFPDLPRTWSVATAEWQGRLERGRILPLADAAMLLDHPERWLLEHADGHVSLCQSDLGETHSAKQWYALARDTAAGLQLG